MGAVNMSKNEILDKKMLMDRLGNDEELVSEVISVFLEDTPLQIAYLKSAEVNRDLKNIIRQGHVIKGASGNVSALRIRQVAVEIEKAGKNGELDIVSSLVAELEAQFQAFQEYLSSSQP